MSALLDLYGRLGVEDRVTLVRHLDGPARAQVMERLSVDAQATGHGPLPPRPVACGLTGPEREHAVTCRCCLSASTWNRSAVCDDCTSKGRDR